MQREGVSFLLSRLFQKLGKINSSTIMDKSVDTYEQNKRFLSASFRNFKKHLFVESPPRLSPFSMLQYVPWTLLSGYNIEKGKGDRNVKIRDLKTHAFNETGLLRRVFQLLLSMIVAMQATSSKLGGYNLSPSILTFDSQIV